MDQGWILRTPDEPSSNVLIGREWPIVSCRTITHLTPRQRKERPIRARTAKVQLQVLPLLPIIGQ